MRSALLSVLLLSAVLSGLMALRISWLNSFSNPGGIRLPVSIRLKSEGEEEHQKLKRQEYFSIIHRAAPGTNWKAMDRETRRLNYERRMTEGMNKTTGIDTLANGNLIGEWKERGSVNQAGRIHTAWLDTISGNLYCGSAGGNVWASDPEGDSWQSLNDDWQFDGISMIRVVPHQTGSRILAGSTGNEFYYSDDDGASWISSSGLGSVQSWGWIRRAITQNDQARTIYLLAQEWDFTNWNAIVSLYRSVDHGSSFIQLQSWDEPTWGNVGHFDIWTPATGDTAVYFINDSLMYLLDTAGNPQSISSIPVIHTGRTMLTGTVTSSSTHLYAYLEKDIWYSPDSGFSWTFVDSIPMSPFSENSFICSLTDSSKLFLGDIECNISGDGGSTWAKVNDWWAYYGSESNRLHADIPGISFQFDTAGNEIMYIGTDGGLYRSSDLGQTVENMSLNGLNVSQYYSTFTLRQNPNFIYAGTQDQGYQRCQTDSGTVLGFQQLVSGDYGHIVSSDGGLSIWMVYPGFADFYPNAPFSGSIAAWNFNGTNPLWIPPLMASPNNPKMCYMAGGNLNGSGSHMIRLRADNALINASEHTFDFDTASGGGFISAMAYSEADTNHWFVLTNNGKFFHSSDAGNSWNADTTFDGPGNHYFYGSSIFPSRLDAATVYIAGSGYSNPAAYVSYDFGMTFTPIDSGLPPTLIYDIIGDAGEEFIFAGTEVGPYVFVVSEGIWYPMDGGIAPQQVYWTLDYIPVIHTVRFGTYGRGIWDFSMPIPVPRAGTETMPPLLVYPNPAKDILNVNWEGEESYNLNLFDMKGSILKSGKAEPAAVFKFDIGGIVPGIYILEASRGNKRGWRKIVVQ